MRLSSVIVGLIACELVLSGQQRGAGTQAPSNVAPAARPYQSSPSIGITNSGIGITSSGIGLSGRSIGGGGPFAYPQRNVSPSGVPPPANPALLPAKRGQDGRDRRKDRGNYLLPLGFVGAPYYPPYDPSHAGDEGAEPPPVPPSSGFEPENSAALSEQIRNLSAAIEDLKNRDLQAPASDTAFSSPETAPPAPPPVTLVLRNGKRQQITSYAVMGSNFWDFSSQPARKIPITTIDVNASIAATEAAGAEFPSFSRPSSD